MPVLRRRPIMPIVTAASERSEPESPDAPFFSHPLDASRPAIVERFFGWLLSPASCGLLGGRRLASREWWRLASWE
jgi:hypothetical protein